MPKNVKNLKIGFDIRNSAIRFISRAVNNMPNIFQCLETDVLDKRISEIMTQCILMTQSILNPIFQKIVQIFDEVGILRGFTSHVPRFHLLKTWYQNVSIDLSYKLSRICEYSHSEIL